MRPAEPQKRAVIYARVSTRNGHQDPEVQLMALRQVAARAGWEIVGEYVDHGISGAKGRDKRPAFDRLLKAAARRQFDVVMAWSVDRLGRSLQDLVAFLSEIHGYGVDLYLDRQGIDTTTPAGKALFQMLGVFAEFEREMIRERIAAGLAKARAKGKRLGRAPVGPEVEREVLARLAAGKGQLKVARASWASVTAPWRGSRGLPSPGRTDMKPRPQGRRSHSAISPRVRAADSPQGLTVRPGAPQPWKRTGRPGQAWTGNLNPSRRYAKLQVGLQAEVYRVSRYATRMSRDVPASSATLCSPASDGWHWRTHTECL